MSRYSSDSDEDDYRNSKSRHKRHRSGSDSSGDSYTQKRNNRRNRRSRTRSRDRNVSRFSRSQKDRYDSTKGRSRSRRSKSPSFRSRRQRSPSRSPSRSRISPNYVKGKPYRKSKRKYRSRSRSRSYSRRSGSRSRRRYRSRSRSRSSSCKKLKRSYGEKNSSSSDEEIHKNINKSRPVIRTTDSKKPTIPEESSHIIISSDDPILKQEQLDELNAPSFAPKSFKSSKSDNTPSFPKHLLSSISEDHITKNIDTEFSINENLQKLDIENRKNETVFHDNIVFEDSEMKIQKWVKKIHKIRQKFLLTQQQ